MSVPATTATAVPGAFLPFVVPFVASAPRAVITQTIAAILKEFLHETQVWQETLAAITLVAAQQPYALTPSDTTNTIFDSIVWAGPTDGSPWTPTEYYGIAPNKTGIYLVYPPATGVTGTFTVRIVLRLKVGASKMDDRIFEDWHEVIAQGAIARLKNMPDTPWTSIKGAAYTLNKYLMGKAAARIEVAHGGVNSTRRATWDLAGYR